MMLWEHFLVGAKSLWPLLVLEVLFVALWVWVFIKATTYAIRKAKESHNE